MTPPSNKIVRDATDELRAVKRRTLCWQVLNWLAPLIGIPVLTLMFLFSGLTPPGLYGLAALFIGALGYCAYLHALLNGRRHGRDPQLHRAKMIWDAAGYFILETILAFIMTYLPLAYIAAALGSC